MNRVAGTGLMAFGAVLGVVGALLRYAIHVQTEGFNLNTAGMILLVVGVGLVVIGLIVMLVSGRKRTSVQESVQRTPDGGTIRTAERDDNALSL